MWACLVGPKAFLAPVVACVLFVKVKQVGLFAVFAPDVLQAQGFVLVAATRIFLNHPQKLLAMGRVHGQLHVQAVGLLDRRGPGDPRVPAVVEIDRGPFQKRRRLGEFPPLRTVPGFTVQRETCLGSKLFVYVKGVSNRAVFPHNVLQSLGLVLQRQSLIGLDQSDKILAAVGFDAAFQVDAVGTSCRRSTSSTSTSRAGQSVGSFRAVGGHNNTSASINFASRMTPWRRYGLLFGCTWVLVDMSMDWMRSTT